MSTKVQITPKDTYDLFIASGALDYSWWDVIGVQGAAKEALGAPEADWHVVVDERDEDGATGAQFVFEHKNILRAVNELARTGEANKPEYMHPAVLKECRKLIKDADEADFDADAADQVLQYVAFERVIYG